MSEIKGIAARHVERTGHHNAQGSVEYIVSELMPDIEAWYADKKKEEDEWKAVQSKQDH